MIHTEFELADRAFREDVIERLTRIEAHAEHAVSHEGRLNALEVWQARLKGAVVGLGAGLLYLGHRIGPSLVPFLTVFS